MSTFTQKQGEIVQKTAQQNGKVIVNSRKHKNRFAAARPPPAEVFGSLLKKSLGNPYLKFLDFSHHFIADAPMRKKIQKNNFTNEINFS